VVNGLDIRWYGPGCKTMVSRALPEAAQDFIRRFDEGKSVRPFKFEVPDLTPEEEACLSA
jgi:hypothetical protein